MGIDIKFIAKKAGVSPTTVSRVLNQTKQVSEPLKTKVMEVVEQYGYSPNFLARGLVLKKSSLVGVIVPNVSNMFHAKIISAIEAYLSEYDHNVIVSNIYSYDDKQRKSFKIMQERRVDGIIMLHENSPELMDEMMRLVSVPLVLASINIEGSTLPKVCIDDERAAYDAASYLIRLGHRRIGGIFVENSYTMNVLRRGGYKRALDEHGLFYNEQIIDAAICSIEQGGQAVERLLRMPEPPTAVFCASDELAIGATNHLIDRGYRVPEDFSVMGFDDIDLAMVLRPRLSTIRQPIEDMGRESAKVLISLINGEPAPGKAVVFPHSLIVRDSCGAIKTPN